MPARLALTLGLAMLIGACSRGETVECPGGSRYQAAESAGPLRVPDDLSVPDESEALQVPPPIPPSEQNDEVECLEYSPAYSGAE